MVTQWEDEESFAAWRDGPAIGRTPASGPAGVLGADLLEFEVVMDVRRPIRQGRTSWPTSPGLVAISQRKPSGSAK